MPLQSLFDCPPSVRQIPCMVFLSDWCCEQNFNPRENRIRVWLQIGLYLLKIEPCLKPLSAIPLWGFLCTKCEAWSSSRQTWEHSHCQSCRTITDKDDDPPEKLKRPWKQLMALADHWRSCSVLVGSWISLCAVSRKVLTFSQTTSCPHVRHCGSGCFTQPYPARHSGFVSVFCNWFMRTCRPNWAGGWGTATVDGDHDLVKGRKKYERSECQRTKWV